MHTNEAFSAAHVAQSQGAYLLVAGDARASCAGRHRRTRVAADGDQVGGKVQMVVAGQVGVTRGF